ncbi:pyridoxal phosphate homeostasis protein [Diorhabda carinulata]|uniref:pyridoxal phosphate homeostasis protein n=1 Tax=Diorhabda carinulata TaxID=1163345 RepID=UPI0025A0CD14|nr:pyridoxal phosphate homeostasis protein [Diorhabda carinulata]
MLKKMSEIDVKQGLKIVLSKIEEACSKRTLELQALEPTLVAVSKTKPVNLIVAAYEDGQRHFGENYVQELEEKANNPIILEKCKDIKWHFIGHLQSNKVNKVISLPNIHLIETVDSQKLASLLDKNWPKFGPPESKLKIMIQVNTSGEEEKNGIAPTEVCNVVQYVLKECKNLDLDGLMTIGKFGYDPADGPNPDFVCLKKCRDDICQALGIDWKDIGLSMGMSDDFEHAIELGSTNVRVGSSIFGYRPKKK